MATTKKVGRPKGAGVAIQLRFPHELATALDREVARLQHERAGNVVTRADVIREIVGRALLTRAKGSQP